MIIIINVIILILEASWGHQDINLCCSNYLQWLYSPLSLRSDVPATWPGCCQISPFFTISLPPQPLHSQTPPLHLLSHNRFPLSLGFPPPWTLYEVPDKSINHAHTSQHMLCQQFWNLEIIRQLRKGGGKMRCYMHGCTHCLNHIEAER